jgi:hypothetical protein
MRMLCRTQLRQNRTHPFSRREKSLSPRLTRGWRGAPDEGSLPWEFSYFATTAGPLVPDPSPSGRRGRGAPDEGTAP